MFDCTGFEPEPEPEQEPSDEDDNIFIIITLVCGSMLSFLLTFIIVALR